MSITTAEVTSWKNDLDAMIGEVTDDNARAALSHLRSALEPYFNSPQYFKSILGKIQMAMISADAEEELTSRSFTDIEAFKAALPEGVTVSAI